MRPERTRGSKLLADTGRCRVEAEVPHCDQLGSRRICLPHYGFSRSRSRCLAQRVALFWKSLWQGKWIVLSVISLALLTFLPVVERRFKLRTARGALWAARAVGMLTLLLCIGALVAAYWWVGGILLLLGSAGIWWTYRRSVACSRSWHHSQLPPHRTRRRVQSLRLRPPDHRLISFAHAGRLGGRTKAGGGMQKA